MAQDPVAAQAEIAKLRFQLARYQRIEFGRSSEKLAREAETPAARGCDPSCALYLPLLWRRLAPDRRGRHWPGRIKVIRHVRTKLSCRPCDTVVAAPDHAIARGRAGAGLLAHIAVSKYDDHLPLYRKRQLKHVLSLSR